MVEISISEISKHPKILDELTEVAKVVNKKERVVRGVFIPLKMVNEDIETLIEKIEREQKRALLERVAKAQKEDMVGDGAVGDGL